MTEIRKDIQGYDGAYQVSSLGAIRSVDRLVKNPVCGMAVRKGKVMTQMKCKWGYARVILTKNGKATRPFVQRIVAAAFIPNTENKKEVNHINGIKTDNRAENLEWVTPRENMLHSYKAGLHPPLKGVKNPKSRKVINLLTGTVYVSLQEAADSIGMRSRNLQKKLSGTHKFNNTNLKYLDACES